MTTPISLTLEHVLTLDMNYTRGFCVTRVQGPMIHMSISCSTTTNATMAVAFTTQVSQFLKHALYQPVDQLTVFYSVTSV